MKLISWGDFEAIELRVGCIVDVQDFPEARKPAYKLTIDFGPETGLKRSSAQLTHLYSKEALLHKQIIGVINFPSKQIGPFVSECLITGFTQEDGAVILAVPDKVSVLGAKLG